MEFFTDNDKKLRKEQLGLPDVFVHTEVISNVLLERLKESYRRGDEEVTSHVGGYDNQVIENFAQGSASDLGSLTKENYIIWAQRIEEKAREISGLGEKLTVEYEYEKTHIPASGGNGPGAEPPRDVESKAFYMKLKSS